MNSEFFNQQGYYLIDVFAGSYRKSKIVFRIVNNSKYNLKNVKEAEIESRVKKINQVTGQEYYCVIKHKAFIKSSINDYGCDLDVVYSEMAALLNIPASRVFHLESDNGLKGVINIGVQKSDEQQLGIDKLFDRVISLLKSRNLELSDWLKQYLSLEKGNLEHIISNEMDIKNTIEAGVNVIKLFFKLNESEVNSLKRNYIQMIFFDLLTGNCYRNFDTYSILLDYNGGFRRLAPIYDYNNELDSKKHYSLNGVYIDRTSLMSVLYSNYYSYIREISRGLLENYSAYLNSISLIIDSNMVNHNNDVKKNVSINMEVFKSLELIHEEQYGESKLDVAMTQTSINLTAVNNNQLVHQKYDNLKKEEVVEAKEEVKINVEPQKRNHNFANLFIIILGLLFLCGIGIGIAYLIMLYYE